MVVLDRRHSFRISCSVTAFGVIFRAYQPHRGSAPRVARIALCFATLAAAPAVLPSGLHAEEAAPTAQRIISLAPSVTETLFALGAGDRLVAVSRHCDYPAPARALPRAGDYLRPSIETIISLTPDVVIGVETPANRAKVDELRRLGVRVVIVPEHTLADAWRSIEIVGGLVGKQVEAAALTARLQEELAAVAASVATKERRRVLFVVGHDPLVAVGQGIFLDELITVAGGENVARNLGRFSGDEAGHAAALGPWPRLSLETVIAAAPEVIIDGAMGTESTESLTAWWAAYVSVPAVRDGRIRAQQGNAMLRPGPRLGEAAREMARLVRGDDG
jgi:iron complex transport system substrate-binding protein